jgi:hypothetical protein
VDEPEVGCTNVLEILGDTAYFDMELAESLLRRSFAGFPYQWLRFNPRSGRTGTVVLGWVSFNYFGFPC